MLSAINDLFTTWPPNCFAQDGNPKHKGVVQTAKAMIVDVRLIGNELQANIAIEINYEGEMLTTYPKLKNPNLADKVLDVLKNAKGKTLTELGSMQIDI